MEKRFRALRTLATLYRIIAWVLLIGGILLATAVVLLGVLASSRGISPLVSGLPVLSQVTGLIESLAVAGVILLYSLIQFLVLYAISEAIHLALAIEQNTRETAYYLRGEAMNSSATTGSWQGQSE